MLFKVSKNESIVNYVSLCVNASTRDFLYKRDYIKSYNDRIGIEEQRFTWMSCATVMANGAIGFNGTTSNDIILVLSEQMSDKRKNKVKEDKEKAQSLYEELYSKEIKIGSNVPHAYATWIPRGVSNDILVEEDNRAYNTILQTLVNQPAHSTWSTSTTTSRPYFYTERYPEVSVNGEITRRIEYNSQLHEDAAEEDPVVGASQMSLREMFRRSRGGL